MAIVLILAALTVAGSLGLVFLIAVGAGMITSYHWRKQREHNPDSD